MLEVHDRIVALAADVAEKIADDEIPTACPQCGAVAATWCYCPGSTKFSDLDEAARAIAADQERRAFVERLRNSDVIGDPRAAARVLGDIIAKIEKERG